MSKRRKYLPEEKIKIVKVSIEASPLLRKSEFN